MRLRTLTLPQKSLFAAATVVASLGIMAVPASAAGTSAADPTTAAEAVIHEPALRPVDRDAAYFASAARGTAKLAHGKVSTANLEVQIALVEQSPELSAESAQTLTGELRAMTASVAAQVVSYDKAQARKAAEAKAAKERARKAAAEKAKQLAAQRAAVPASTGRATPVSSSGGSSPAAARAFAKSYMAGAYGWGGDQFACLNSLWNRESGWRVHAANPSGAYGIPQALPGSKMGAGWQNSAEVQIKWGLRYIKARYSTPCGAWSHSQSTGWY
ncbi:lytic transglycosylase domain-containing protein [Microbacterium luticocti]|uniref:aggregation-promoting factor C-terminal-like domain-containing protein n=1 Tax=Microbacterium luticocti TaxID=451764 RepID=UPI0003F9E9E9|nr:lytic transglycosylase domain-containing protein [Microbacterium luticocti]